ncbi:MAG: hypothetical protein AMS24_03210 [Chlamydiae bacterium SM23_39]|nr:MAG: hypothetical protein AMS24_03210 [Chlamydiae bacterium SM23_39]
MKKFKKSLFSIVFLCFLAFLLFCAKEIKSLKDFKKSYKIYVSKAKKEVYCSMPLLEKISLPLYLQNIPLANQEKLVLQTKTISIRNAYAPYNASIIKNPSKEGYLLFFRYDKKTISSPYSYNSYIGCVELDKNFDQTKKKFKKINTSSNYSEDPRVITVGKDTYLIYNDLLTNSCNCRTMRIAKINLNNYKIEYSTDLDLNLQPIEKNWTPFEYIENDKPEIYFEYYINPHKIFKLPNPKKNELLNLQFSNRTAYQKKIWWKFWGILRGGTPAKKISENQYLTFFHSSFKDKKMGITWYLLGAYTFEAKPPFRITAISNYPILFEGMYDSPYLNTGSPKKRVIFPCGFVVEKNLIHLSCGENDSAVKIITLDKNVLLKSLKKL